MRIVLYWHDVAPRPDIAGASRRSTRPTRRPTTGRATTPLVDGAKARGWNVLLTCPARCPRWATNGARDTLTRPSPSEFRPFVHRRRPPLRQPRSTRGRSGTSPTSRSSCCRSTRRRPHAALAGHLPQALPRRLQRGLRATPACANARVLIGETSPRGTRQGRRAADLPARRAVPGLAATTSAARAARSCRPTGYAHHAYTTRRRARSSSPRSPTTSRSACSRG